MTWYSITQVTSCPPRSHNFLFVDLIMPTRIDNTRQVCRWTITINNWTPDDEQRLRDLAAADTTKYLIFGREVGESGTPHLQGFVIFSRSVRFTEAKARIGDNAHIEVAVRPSAANRKYCSKDGDFEEFGDFPGRQGKRNDWEDYKEWVLELGRLPTHAELVAHNTSLFVRYKRACYEVAEAILPAIDFTGEETPRFGWQTNVDGLIRTENPSERFIYFVVDPVGNTGKSWMCRYAMSKMPDKVQVLRIGKRDDLSYAIDPNKSVFLFDIPRNQMTFLQYSVLEMLKDRMIFSSKYESSLKMLRKTPMVIVFCNEQPDMSNLSADRFKIINV